MRGQYYNIMGLIVAHMEENPNPHYRYGQHIFNTLYIIAPELANIIRGTNADPFYDNKKVPAFWTKLEELSEQ